VPPPPPANPGPRFGLASNGTAPPPGNVARKQKVPILNLDTDQVRAWRARCVLLQQSGSTALCRV